MFYTIIAAVALIFSSLLFAVNRLVWQNTETGHFFDRDYGREFQLVKATVDGVSMIGTKRYAISCKINGSSDCVDIEAPPERLKRLQNREELYLMEYTTQKAKLYCIAPISDMGLCDALQITRLTTFDAEDVEVLDKKAQMAHKLDMLLIAAAFFTCPTTPLTSLVFSILSIIITVFAVPLTPWTRAKGFDIIKAESSSLKAKDRKQDKPVGFADWSETNKELFSIEQRLRNTAQENQNEAADPIEEPETERVHGSVDSGDGDKNDFDPSEKEFRVCRACGCIVSESAQYCESCGHKLSDDTGSETTREVEEAPISVENDSQPKAENDSGDSSSTSSMFEEATNKENDSTEAGQTPSQDAGKRQHRNRRQRKRKPAASNDIEEMLKDIANQE